MRLAAFALILATLSVAAPARAAAPDIYTTVNTRKEICGALLDSIRFRPMLLTYDPELELAKPLRLRRGHPGAIMPAGRNNVFPMVWDKQLSNGMFAMEDREHFKQFVREGLEYDRNYFVQQTSVNFFNKYKPNRVFLRRNLGNNRIPLNPLLFMKDGTPLATAFNALQASDMVQYIADSFPIVRKPNEITVYQMVPASEAAASVRAETICQFRTQ
ncbi:MAG: hypothetical protein K0R10_1431 [Alphaproteobacteria bacterium]|jgi:hypothetical protein|nr:hypothetical protein [Alphaproteobacteria bacterium]